MPTMKTRLGPTLSMILLAACGGVQELPGQETWETDFTKRTVDLDEIISGGPPKDGIPAIDNPKFISADEADDFLEDDEPVAVVRRNGVAKAYPIQILIYHEIVNDAVGGDPISVTYCPLCNTTLAFDRRFEGDVLDFGTTGRLRHSDLVMYDRQTETWWQQATGEGIVGEHAGKQLTFVSSPVMRWEDVKEQLSGVQVLSRDTGHGRYSDWYGQNPYEGYDRRSGPMAWAFKISVPDQLPRMERVVALYEDGESWAVGFSDLREERVAHLEVGDKDVVVFFTPETVSSVDARRIADSRAVGSSAVYERAVDGRRLTFEPTRKSGEYRDEETGSTWNFAGVATQGELEGTQLVEVPHGNHFWFAWVAFRPETKVWEP